MSPNAEFGPKDFLEMGSNSKQEVGMLTYTQRLFMGQFRRVYAGNLFSELLDKSSRLLMPLFLPADTTDNESEGQLQIAKYKAYNISGSIKAVFWVAISIFFALWLGRLS